MMLMKHFSTFHAENVITIFGNLLCLRNTFNEHRCFEGNPEGSLLISSYNMCACDICLINWGILSGSIFSIFECDWCEYNSEI